MKFKSDIEVQAGLKDSSGSNGTSGQVLSTTGSTVSWINQTTIANDVQNLVKAGVAINKGQAVYVTGADGTNIIVGLASNTSEATSSKTLGLLNATVAINGMADVVQIGRLSGLNTIGATVGDPVWLGTNGNLIYGLANKPYAPAHLVFLGIVTRVNSNNGEIFVNVQNGFELNEIHDVDLKTTVPINGDILGYNGTLWVNKTIAGWLGYTPANASGTTNYVAKFTGSTTLGNSQIFDDATNVGIGTANPGSKLTVNGDIKMNVDGSLYLGGGGSAVPTWRMSPNGNNLEISGVATNTTGNVSFLSLGNVGIGTSSPLNRLDIVSTTLGSFDAITVRPSNLTQTLNIGWRGISASFDFRLNTASVERMIVTTAGDVGIGTDVPTAKLNVLGSLHTGSYSRAATTTIENRTNKAVFVISSEGVTNGAGTTLAYGWADGGQGPLKFANTTGEVMRLTPTGNLLINTTSSIYFIPSKAEILFNGLVEYGINFKSTTAAAIPVSFIDSTGFQIGRIYYDAGGTQYQTFSDYRLKEDLKPINGLELVSKMKVYDYKIKSCEKRSYGVLAHELQEIVPMVVSGEKDGKETQYVDYSKLVPILIQAIKDLKAEIELLK